MTAVRIDTVFRRALTCVLLAACGTAGAQTLDLAAAHAAALAHEASLRASRAAADAGRELVPQARARLLPQLTASAARSRNQLVNTGAAANGAPLTTRDGYVAGHAGLSLRQALYRPFEQASLRQAQARAEESDAQLERAVQDLAVRVAESYFELLLADEQIALVDAKKTAYTTQLDAATQAYQAGSGTRTDIDEVQARLDLSVAEELQAREHRVLARRQLQTLVGRPFDAVAPLDVAALRPAPPEPDTLEAWLAQAERHSPEIRALQAQLDAARHEVERARAGHRPTLDAVADWSRNESDNINRIGSRYTTKSVGLQLSVPLYAGGGVDAAVRQALAEETRTAETLQALLDDLGIRIAREFAGVGEGVLRIRALEQAVRSAEQVVRANRRSFEAGVRTTVDVLNAEQQRVSALRDLAQARFLYLMARVRLQVLAGVFDAHSLNDINRHFRGAAAASVH